MTLSIDAMYAFIAVDEDGEGVTAFQSPKMGWIPMVAADKDRVDSLRPIAQGIATQTGQRIVLAKFEQRTDLEILEPE